MPLYTVADLSVLPLKRTRENSVSTRPGLIDVTRDLMPVADADPARPHIYFIFGCAGLPWAAWCGDHMAARIGGAPKTDVASLLRWDRRPFIPDALQSVLGKPASFALDFFAIKNGVRYRE